MIRRKKSPPKTEPNTLSPKQIAYELRWELFRKVWSKRPHVSQISGTPLRGELKNYYCDHLLERSNYPLAQYQEWNILLVTEEEHSRKGRGFPGSEQPTDEKYKLLIKQALERYETETLHQATEEGS